MRNKKVFINEHYEGKLKNTVIYKKTGRYTILSDDGFSPIAEIDRCWYNVRHRRRRIMWDQDGQVACIMEFQDKPRKCVIWVPTPTFDGQEASEEHPPFIPPPAWLVRQRQEDDRQHALRDEHHVRQYCMTKFQGDVIAFHAEYPFALSMAEVDTILNDVRSQEESLASEGLAGIDAMDIDQVAPAWVEHIVRKRTTDPDTFNFILIDAVDHKPTPEELEAARLEALKKEEAVTVASEHDLATTDLAATGANEPGQEPEAGSQQGSRAGSNRSKSNKSGNSGNSGSEKKPVAFVPPPASLKSATSRSSKTEYGYHHKVPLFKFGEVRRDHYTQYFWLFMETSQGQLPVYISKVKNYMDEFCIEAVRDESGAGMVCRLPREDASWSSKAFVLACAPGTNTMLICTMALIMEDWKCENRDGAGGLVGAA
jgi:hypothetical protein